MSGISKRVSGSWVSGDYGIMGTSTDTLTTLPADIYADGNNATVGISGNMIQSGTPNPDNPVMPNGCGNMTGNVMPAGELKTVESNGVTFSSDGNGRYRISGTATEFASVRFDLLSGFTAPISVSNGGQGTLSFFNTQSNNKVTLRFYNGTTIVDSWNQAPIRRTTTGYNALGNKYVDNVAITVSSGATVDMTITPEFTNDGILPTEFEPYGYKIPISSAGQTTPIYLGEVQTTRKIKKLVLTGEEVWIKSESRIGNMYTQLVDAIISGFGFCDRAVNTRSLDEFSSSGKMLVESNNSRSFLNIWLFDTAISVANFKSYLATQYANGTPVTVWYVLTTEETGIVNEPLMRIGDYADEVSGITIPTIAGADSFDVETTLKPSEVSLTYTGWHGSSVKEWDGSEWQ